uniref:Zinc finger protein 550 n=1 Tax=Bos indicus x Bos taurus TaxID=30522 RepID=A0A4W2GUL3_BOBOX
MSACEALRLGRPSDRVRAAPVLSLLWPLLELRLEHFSQSTSLCPQTSWNTTVCVLSRGLLHLRLSSQPQLLYVPRLHLLPPEPSTELGHQRPHDSGLGLCTFTSTTVTGLIPPKCTSPVLLCLTLQVVVTFKDVAVTFTREEWGQLDLGQRTLFREVMLETCGLLVSLGHPIPKPELIHLLEHGQKLWTGTRGLPHSTSPGDRPKCQPRDSSSSQPVLSEEALLQGSLTLGSSWDSRLGRAGAPQGLLETRRVPETPEMDAGKEAHPGKVSLEDDGLGAGDGLHLGAFQKSVSRGDVLHERDPQRPGKGPPSHHLYKCKQCGKAFNRKWYLVRHQRIHTGMKPYECNACGKAFSQSSTLIRHYLIHTGEKPFQCAECGKAFKRRSYLRQHQPAHTGEKPYTCSQCRKAFTHRSTFIRHHRTHSGEKPFECKDCEKAFSSRAHLIQHYVIHTGEKPYECAECAKAFRCSSELQQHQRVHTGEKPYTCAQCGKAFHRSTYLLQHSVIHTPETPFKCAQCGKAFKRRSHLLQHRRVHS